MTFRKPDALLVLVFADLTGFSMLIPDIQLRAERLGAHGWMIGAILSSMFVVQAVVSPLWGSLSDRIGRKPVILVCTGFSALAMLVYSQAAGVWVILASRILAGLGAANVSTAMASVADAYEPGQRTKQLGLMGAASSAGLIVGPALGGVVSARGGAPLLGSVAAGISVVGLLAVALLLPRAPAAVSGSAEDRRDFRLFQGRPILLILFVSTAVGWFSLACLEGTFGRLIERTLGLGVLAFGLIFGYESLLSVLVQSLLVDVAKRRLGDRRVVLVSFILQGLGLAAMPFARSLPLLLAAATVYAVGGGLLGPSLNGWCSRLTPENRQGAMFGLLQSTRSIGFMVGPSLGGALFDVKPMYPYILAGGVSALAALFVAASTKDVQGSPSPFAKGEGRGEG